jgi:hypothetical protein
LCNGWCIVNILKILIKSVDRFFKGVDPIIFFFVFDDHFEVEIVFIDVIFEGVIEIN